MNYQKLADQVLADAKLRRKVYDHIGKSVVIKSQSTLAKDFTATLLALNGEIATYQLKSGHTGAINIKQVELCSQKL